MSEARLADDAGADDGADGTALRPAVTQVADNFVELMRSFGQAKARFLTEAAHDVEWSAHVILRRLAAVGPMRAGAIAESLHSDPSTVSRQVAVLVKDGLVERQADPEDGRASIIVLTAKADSVLADQERYRNTHFAEMLAGWSDRDLQRFAALLRRFTTDFDSSTASVLSERSAARRRSAEGKS